MSDKSDPVKIEERLVRRIGVREWGMPQLCIPGQVWRSETHNTVSCMLASEDPTKVKIDTRPLIVIPVGEMSELPYPWREALWDYTQAWPSSGYKYGPFLALTEEVRCDFIRKWAKELVDSDNLGCRAIANDIGEFAAYGYQLPEPPKP